MRPTTGEVEVGDRWNGGRRITGVESGGRSSVISLVRLLHVREPSSLSQKPPSAAELSSSVYGLPIWIFTSMQKLI